jgi:hypothetical protein
MTKYLVLYKSSASAGEQMGSDPAAAEANMGLWMTWMGKVGSALVDPGSPLAEVSELPATGDGSGRHVGGYSILEADSLKDVEALLDGHPHYEAPSASIAVLELLPIPGM